MAIFHLTVKAGTRAKGTVAARKADYIQRENQYEKQPDACLYKESGNLPDWAENGRDYWQAADQFERANGRLFVEVEFALPRDLSQDEQLELARTYAHDLTEDNRLPYTLAVHEGRGVNFEQTGGNPHAHLMISERINDGVERSPEGWFSRANREEPSLGGALKSREFHGGEQITALRERWAERVNHSLEQAQSLERVSHRTLEAQGVDREPSQHIGPPAFWMAERGAQSDRAQMFAQEYGRQRQLEREIGHVEHQLGELAQERRQELERDYGAGLED